MAGLVEQVAGAGEVWRVLWLVENRRAFVTGSGLVGRGVLDYPPGFEWQVPQGLSAEAQMFFHLDGPSFVVWDREHRVPLLWDVPGAASGEGWRFVRPAGEVPVGVLRHAVLMEWLCGLLVEGRASGLGEASV